MTQKTGRFRKRRIDCMHLSVAETVNHLQLFQATAVQTETQCMCRTVTYIRAYRPSLLFFWRHDINGVSIKLFMLVAYIYTSISATFFKRYSE